MCNSEANWLGKVFALVLLETMKRIIIAVNQQIPIWDIIQAVKITVSSRLQMVISVIKCKERHNKQESQRCINVDEAEGETEATQRMCSPHSYGLNILPSEETGNLLTSSDNRDKIQHVKVVGFEQL